MTDKPRALHEILSLMERHLRAAKEDKYGVIKCQVPGLFSVRITPALIGRALSFVRTVATSADERGYPIDHQGATGFLVKGTSIGAFFSEAIHRVDHVPTEEEMAKPWYKLIGPQKFDFVGSGQLKLEFAALAGRRAFGDKPGRPVERQIDEMMLALLELEGRSKTELEKIAKRTETLRAAEARREEARKVAEAQRQAIAELESEAASWVRANNLRAYIAAVEEKAENLTDAPKMAGWISRARAHVETMDPMERRLAALLHATETERLLSDPDAL